MSTQKQLKQEILDKVKEYYDLVHKPAQNREFNSEKDRVNYSGRIFDHNEIQNLVDSSLDFWLTFGDYSKQFEKKLGDFLNVSNVLFLNSGSSANLLAFMALTSPLLKKRQVKRGDEIITVAAAFPTTVSPIIQYGAVPVFVDIELETCNIDINQLECALSNKTKAVILAHTLGNPFNIKVVKEFCVKHNLWLIEDNCDALGSKYDNQFTGTYGDIGTSSFYPPHHITTGEGGAVYTNNPLLKKIMLSMRDWGRDCWCESGVDNTCNHRFSQQFGSLPKGYDHKYVYSHFGYNLKATDMQAAIGVAQMDKINFFTKRRIENFSILYNGLKDLNDFFILPKAAKNSVPSWFGFLLIIKDESKFTRNDISKYLESKQIQTRNLFSGNIVKHPLFENLENNIDYKVSGELVNTDIIMNRGFWIGVYPGMNRDKLNYIINTIKQFVIK